jgi:hypothetical protein
MPILTIQNPFPGIQSLKVYEAIRQTNDLTYPIELDNDIFMMKWNDEDKWHCNGISDIEVMTGIGRLIEEK